MPNTNRIYLRLNDAELEKLEHLAESARKDKAAYVKDLMLTSWKSDYSSDFLDLKRDLSNVETRFLQVIFLLRKLIQDSSVNQFRIESVLRSLPVQEQVEMRSEMATFVEQRMQRYEDALAHLSGGGNVD
jgi:hypothetical protein